MSGNFIFWVKAPLTNVLLMPSMRGPSIPILNYRIWGIPNKKLIVFMKSISSVKIKLRKTICVLFQEHALEMLN